MCQRRLKVYLISFLFLSCFGEKEFPLSLEDVKKFLAFKVGQEMKVNIPVFIDIFSDELFGVNYSSP